MQQIKTLIIPITLVIFSFLLNFFYSSKGVLPIDTFAHFDTGFRVTQGEIPFKDYWTTSGLFIDIFQFFLFNIFGVSWSSYIINGSIINALITLFLFFFLKEINIKTGYAFFYSFCFSILANPSIGTPFVDHYSAFFSLLSVIFFLLAVKKNNFYLWYFIPIFLFVGFFCKQTPSGYIFLLMIFNLAFYTFTNKKTKWIKPVLTGTLTCLIIFAMFIFLNEIDIKLFLIQYFFFPSTIGELRFEKFELSLKRIVLDFKFIHILLLPLIILTIKNILNKKSKIFLIILNFNFIILSLFFIFHQILTWNFIFIFFLIPVLAAVVHSNFILLSLNKDFLKYFVIAICIIGTLKFHFRFNEERKFINLEGIDINKFEKAEIIDNKLKGLKWITMDYPNNPKNEIKFIKRSLEIIKQEQKNLMFIGNYQFFSSILDKKTNAPNRWYATGVSHPTKQNRYYNEYVNFIKNLIIKKKIEVIYLHQPIKNQHLDIIQDAIMIIPKKCDNSTREINEFVIVDINNCH